MDSRPLYVASDLHIGDHGPRDNFTNMALRTADGTGLAGRREQFLLFLRQVKNDGGRLLLIGDVFEFWQSNIGDVLSRNIDLLDELAGLDDVEILLGNHDLDLKGMIENPALKMRDAHPVFRRIVMPGRGAYAGKALVAKTFRDGRTGEDRVFGFLHGNEVDVYNRSSVPGAGRAIAILAGMVEDGVGGPFLPDSHKLVEEDLMDKALKLKKGIPGYILSKVFSRSNFLIFLLSASWMAVSSVYLVGLIWQARGVWAFVPVVIIALPVLIVCLAIRYLTTAVTGDIGELTGDFREYLKILMDKLPTTRTATLHPVRKDTKDGNDGLVELMRENACDVMVLGHTHVDDLTEYGCNSGAWASDKPSFLKISPDGDVELYRWQALSETGGEPVLRKRLSFVGGQRVVETFEPFAHPETREGNLGCLSSIPGA